MKIRSFKSVTNGVYRVIIRIEDVSQQDEQLMLQYGQPTVELGGTFTPVAPAPQFTLPARSALILAGDYVFRQEFDSRDTDYAAADATAWHAEVVDRITEAMITLRTNTDTFTTEEVVQI